MSARECVYVSHRIPFESPPSPNSTVNHITVELRLFFPPNATADLLLEKLAEAVREAENKIQTHQRQHQEKVWLSQPRTD